MALGENHTADLRVVGHVKWFDASKGFGFISSDEGGSDVLLHVNVLRNFGQNSVADGARIEVIAHRTERGVQATEVLQIEAPVKGTAALADLADLEDVSIEDLPLEPARVKWFDKGKGFGFANIFGKSEDIFLHKEVVRQSGLSDLQPGEALALRVIEGRRGRMAAEVHPWEDALSSNMS